jgi:hypothetical protein
MADETNQFNNPAPQDEANAPAGTPQDAVPAADQNGAPEALNVEHGTIPAPTDPVDPAAPVTPVDPVAPAGGSDVEQPQQPADPLGGEQPPQPEEPQQPQV